MMCLFDISLESFNLCTGKIRSEKHCPQYAESMATHKEEVPR